MEPCIAKQKKMKGKNMGTVKKSDEQKNNAQTESVETKKILDGLLSLKNDICGYQNEGVKNLLAMLEKNFSSIELSFQALQQELAEIKAEVQNKKVSAAPAPAPAPVATPKPYQGTKRQPTAKKLEISIDKDGNKVYSCFASPMQLLIDQINSGLAILVESNAKVLVYQCQNYVAKRFTNQSNFFVVCSQDLSILEQFNNHKELGWAVTDKTTQQETTYSLPCTQAAPEPALVATQAQQAQQTTVANVPMPSIMQKRLGKMQPKTQPQQVPPVPPPEEQPPF